MDNELFVRLTKPHIEDADWLQPERFSGSLTRGNVMVLFIDADLSRAVLGLLSAVVTECSKLRLCHVFFQFGDFWLV